MSGSAAYPEPPTPGTDPRTPGADRRPDFYDRAGNELTCRECGTVIDHLTSDWIDARIRDVFPCPGCGLGSRLPVDDDGSGS